MTDSSTATDDLTAALKNLGQQRFRQFVKTATEQYHRSTAEGDDRIAHVWLAIVARPDLVRLALAELLDRRRPFMAVAASFRDRYAEKGDPEMAAVWQALILLAVEVEDDEREIVKSALRPPRDGVVEIVDDDDDE